MATVLLCMATPASVVGVVALQLCHHCAAGLI